MVGTLTRPWFATPTGGPPDGNPRMYIVTPADLAPPPATATATATAAKPRTGAGGGYSPSLSLGLAWESGKAWGRMYSRDPQAMARDFGWPVREVSADEMTKIKGTPTPAGREYAGLCVRREDGAGFGIYLRAGLSAEARARTLGHELAHARFWGARASEAFCEHWAAAFLSA
ncbi:MAG: hypothetical protein HY689_09870 [Chloroflexi bacterium]|nr:hypothetical protein [Chloroflexota bacterium]